MSTAFTTGARVRFAQQRLSTLAPRDRKGLAGRIGVVQTDAKLVKKPTVYFPTDGARSELRLFRVEPAHLELVENAPDTSITPAVDAGAKQAAHANSNAEAPALQDNGELSQSDLDKLFE
jgi:hypothetical protein